jgi:hypothetical protein
MRATEHTQCENMVTFPLTGLSECEAIVPDKYGARATAAKQGGAGSRSLLRSHDGPQPDG